VTVLRLYVYTSIMPPLVKLELQKYPLLALQKIDASLYAKDAGG